MVTQRFRVPVSGFFLGLLVLFTALLSTQQDFSKVEIKTTKIAGNFYTLEGQGGTIGVLAGPDGVLHGRQRSSRR